MSENRDEATGLFTQSTENLFGREHELTQAGYSPMPDRPKDKGAEFATVNDAADALAASRAEAAPIEEVFYLRADNGERLNADPEEGVVESVTPERAAHDLTAYRNANADNGAKSVSAHFAAEVDKMRADAIKGNPKLAEHYGVETLPDEESKSDEPKSERANNNKSSDETAETSDGDLDPELAESIRKHPQVREFIAAEREAEVTEMRQAREAYSSGLDTALTLQLNAIADSVPELQHVPAEQRAQWLANLAQQNPARFDQIMAPLDRAHKIQQAQQQHSQWQAQQRAHAEQQQFEAHVSSEDARLVALFGGDKVQADAATEATLSYLREHGVPREQMLNVFATNPVLRTAEARKTILEAQKWRDLQKMAKPTPSRSIPPVQRPGVAPSRSDTASAKVQSLEKQLGTATGNKALRISADIVTARRGTNGRG